MVPEVTLLDLIVAGLMIVIFSALFTAVRCLYNMPSEADIANDQKQTYCEMVALHKADPTIGWPDYKRIYDKECDE